ncbi:hypothetical protein ABZ465_21425 [Streptomyces griseoincarnatus]
MTFLVVVEGDAGGWRIDRDALTAAICARWTGVEVDSTSSSAARALVWEFETEIGPGEAYLHEDGTCLYMDVRQENAIWLATVFRELTPANLTWCSATGAAPLTFALWPGLPRPTLRSWSRPQNERPSTLRPCA